MRFFLLFLLGSVSLTGCTSPARQRGAPAPPRAAAASENISASIAADNLRINPDDHEVVIELDLENRGAHPVVVSRKSFRVIDTAGNEAYLEQEGPAFADSSTAKALQVGFMPVGVVLGVMTAPIVVPIAGVVRAAQTLSPSPTEQEKLDEATRSFRWKDFIMQPGTYATVFLLFDADRLDMTAPLTLRLEGVGSTLELPLEP